MSGSSSTNSKNINAKSVTAKGRCYERAIDETRSRVVCDVYIIYIILDRALAGGESMSIDNEALLTNKCIKCGHVEPAMELELTKYFNFYELWSDEFGEPILHHDPTPNAYSDLRLEDIPELIGFLKRWYDRRKNFQENP